MSNPEPDRDVLQREAFVDLLFEKLIRGKSGLEQQWLNPRATDTRHFVVDELLPAELCSKIHAAFPQDGAGFFSLDSFGERKRTSLTLADYPPILTNLTHAFQSPTIVDLIADICGFREIEPDPRLDTGGLSMMFRDDFLNPHLDNSHDASRGRYRRLNLLYFVSPGWRTEFGGNFELWDATRSAPKTLSAFGNRLVVMETGKSSWYSVSRVVVDRPRCCISNYYFSKTSPDQTDYFHVDAFSGRPEEPFKRLLGVVDKALRTVASRNWRVAGRDKPRLGKARD